MNRHFDKHTGRMAQIGLAQQVALREMYPTPNATDGSHGGLNQKGGKGDLRLSSAVHMWPTPTKADGSGGPGNSGRSGGVNLRTAVSIPTPTVHGNYNRKGASATSGDGLATFVKLWPTPRAGNHGSRPNGKGGKVLEEEVKIAEGQRARGEKLLPTPTCNDAKNSTLPPSQRDRDGMAGFLMRDGEQSGAQLNPDWVEWLMGWVIGWSSIELLTTIRPHDWSIEPPDVPRVATGIANRVDRLTAIGNGQVPQCAAEAWRRLASRSMGALK